MVGGKQFGHVGSEVQVLGNMRIKSAFINFRDSYRALFEVVPEAKESLLGGEGNCGGGIFDKRDCEME